VSSSWNEEASQRPDQRRDGRADVAGHGDGRRRLAVHVSDPLGRRRLAVRPGHRDELVVEEPPGQLQLAEHGQPTASRRDGSGSVLRYAGTLDERPGAGGKYVA
jgi:hypothetical protein